MNCKNCEISIKKEGLVFCSKKCMTSYRQKMLYSIHQVHHRFKNSIIEANKLKNEIKELQFEIKSATKLLSNTVKEYTDFIVTTEA